MLSAFRSLYEGIAPSDSYKVPLYSRDPEEGSIEYLAKKTVLDSTDGFFSFSFYMRDPISRETTPKQSDLYLKGMSYYQKILGKAPFTNWKLLIYTDGFTYKKLQTLQTLDISTLPRSTRYNVQELKEYSSPLITNPNVIFAIVTWPKHQRRKSLAQINGGVLRSLRSRAPFDFPTKYVFIRDADTFFDDYLKELDYAGRYVNASGEHDPDVWQAAKNGFRDTLYTWEKGFFEKIPTIQAATTEKSVLIIGTGEAGFGASGHVYKRPWHSNELLQKNAPFGVFAGLISVTPGVPVYQDMKAWDDFVEYINGRSRRNEEHPTSKFKEQYYRDRGKSTSRSEPIDDENFAKYRQSRIDEYKNKAVGQQNISEIEKNIYYFFSNNADIHRIGRDEQLYLFIIMPRALNNLFIFKADLGDSTPPAVNLPFNTKYKGIYQAAVNAEFTPEKKGGTRKQKRKGSTRKQSKK